MHVRRILALAVATPVLLATLGVTAAAARPGPTAGDQPAASDIWSRPDPNRSHPGHDPKQKSTDDDMDAEDGLVGGLAGGLLGRV
ncbi:hypothetical protein AB0D11_21970 [Streptomyces monashensis]|jgi:hypothetical protein|uniref:hypothetical protein n=1 Tax=Streptomyces monashensis TaxID=1678012 RepID=UPI0033E1CAE7